MPSPSLPRIEEEAHRQHIVLVSVGERTEPASVSRRLDRSLGLEVEREAARAGRESQIGNRSITVNQEKDFRPKRDVPRGTLPPAVDLRHDVAQVFRVRELLALDFYRLLVAAGRRRLSGERLRIGRRAWRRLPIDLRFRRERRRWHLGYRRRAGPAQNGWRALGRAFDGLGGRTHSRLGPRCRHELDPIHREDGPRRDVRDGERHNA